MRRIVVMAVLAAMAGAGLETPAEAAPTSRMVCRVHIKPAWVSGRLVVDVSQSWFRMGRAYVPGHDVGRQRAASRLAVLVQYHNTDGTWATLADRSIVSRGLLDGPERTGVRIPLGTSYRLRRLRAFALLDVRTDHAGHQDCQDSAAFWRTHL